MKNRKILKRVGFLALTALLLCAMLVSCGGNKTPETKWTSADVDAPT